MSSINFDNVWLLFIAIPIIALVSVPFAFAVRSDNRNGHNIASLVLHIVMAVLIAFATAGTSAVTVITRTQVYVVADVSYSARKNLDTMDGYIENLSRNLPRNSQIGLVCFAKDPVLITELGGEMQSVKTAIADGNENALDQTETNIVEALEFTGELFSGDAIKRIVLVSDGKQSDLRDANSLKRTADELAVKGIKLDAIYLDDNLAENAHEIQVSGAEYTKTAFLNGENERVTVLVQSSYSLDNVRMSMYRDGEQVQSKSVNLTAGTNTVNFDLYTLEENSFDYEVRVEGLEEGEDECLYNNSITFTQYVSGAVSVMLLTGDARNVDYVKDIYGEAVTFDEFVLGRDDVKSIPVSVEQLSKYDEIVIADADITMLNSPVEFVDSLEKLVSVLGKHLITVGNLHIQNSQEEALRQFDDILPVRFGYNDNDPKLYTIVIDTSRSMETNSRMIMAKEASRQLVSMLSDSDQVCIVEFNGDVRVALAPTLVSRREKILTTIDELGVMQGTLIYNGMEAAYNQIINLTMFREKQLMLITDGLSYSASETEGSVADMARKMRSSGIQVSVIDVGRGGGGSSTDATATFLRGVASAGGGNYSYCIRVEDLNKVMFSEVAGNVTESVINVSSSVVRNRRSDGAYDGFEAEETGYVETVYNNSAKGSATTVLKARYYKVAISDYSDAPLYAYWNYGEGKVSTYASSIFKNKADTWNNKTAFLKNVFGQNVPEVKNSAPYTLDVSVEGTYATVRLAPVNFYSDARAEAKVTAGGDTKTYQLNSDSEGFYLEFEASEAGKYEVSVDYYCNGGQTPYSSSASVNIPYKSEYDVFASFDASDLYRMVGGNGTVSEDGNLKIENDDKDVGTYVYSLTVPLLIVCAVLFIADVIVRKLKWADIKNLFVKLGKNN